MNRADLLYSVLRDGKPHSRRDIFERVGYMLTNNSASELRARGFDVQHSREGRVDVYLLVRGGGQARREPAAPAPSSEQADPPFSRAACSPSGALMEREKTTAVAQVGSRSVTSPESAPSRSVSAPEQTVPAPERLGKPAADPTSRGASGLAHEPDGAGAGQLTVFDALEEAAA